MGSFFLRDLFFSLWSQKDLSYVVLIWGECLSTYELEFARDESLLLQPINEGLHCLECPALLIQFNEETLWGVESFSRPYISWRKPGSCRHLVLVQVCSSRLICFSLWSSGIWPHLEYALDQCVPQSSARIVFWDFAVVHLLSAEHLWLICCWRSICGWVSMSAMFDRDVGTGRNGSHFQSLRCYANLA